MELLTARLLAIFLVAIAVAAAIPSPTPSTMETTVFSTSGNQVHSTTAANLNSTPSGKIIDYARPFANVKDILMQEIHDLDKDTPDAKVSASFT